MPESIGPTSALMSRCRFCWRDAHSWLRRAGSSQFWAPGDFALLLVGQEHLERPTILAVDRDVRLLSERFESVEWKIFRALDGAESDFAPPAYREKIRQPRFRRTRRKNFPLTRRAAIEFQLTKLTSDASCDESDE